MVLKQRLRITLQGIVQGVGFRPFVYRLATELGLVGWVNNSAQGVTIEVEGHTIQLEIFLRRLEKENPPPSVIHRLQSSWLAPTGDNTFKIRPSTSGKKTALLLPDLATCADCLREIFDPSNRRYRYPFTNCTHCGPRFSIMEGLPYDRSQTTMKHFQMCDRCQEEYNNPLDRRFHAQPNACPACGPHLELWNGSTKLASRDEALLMAVQAIRQGKIVAIKGLGGFHLVVDAGNLEAVRRLRNRKGRPEKPLALMYPSLELIEAHCQVSALEAQLLCSPQAPIVLLRKKNQGGFCQAVAPKNPGLGVMLPYTPLHHLLMAELSSPVVATSGNLTDEPICTDERTAPARLGNLADLVLLHNRPIARSVDDSVVREMAGRELVLRRARGYAPLPVFLGSQSFQGTVLAVGAQLKNAIALGVEQQVILSQHIGDLETVPAFEGFQNTIRDFQHLYELTPSVVAADAHPHYLSTQEAQRSGIPTVVVQHHYAHILSCMAENRLLEDCSFPVLGIAWDGTGYGLDGTIWGGEFLLVTQSSFERVAHLRPLRLPGGDKAIKEPRRSAIGLLYELFGDELFELKLPLLQTFTERELSILQTMLQRQLNSPLTSSAGRLFDAVAAMTGICQQTTYEGQAAIALEFAVSGYRTEQRYPFELRSRLHRNRKLPAVVDWETTIRAILFDLEQGLPRNAIATKFHNTLVETIAAVAKRVGQECIVLSGGCFQNQYLTERAIKHLQEEGFHPYWHRRVPSNDGGIALGQITAVLRNRSRED
ncbi:MAG: carbamoyltransferase HypF [Cyanophyceae cyanobacterium]